MSQPPPPPSQPPQGGFGPPPEPESGPSLDKQQGGQGGSYGYPQQPGQPPQAPPGPPGPPGAGYGYPQQPGQPPQAPPGPPGPPGAGYGYPQQPGQPPQGPYGQPPQPPYGTPPYGQQPGMYPTMPGGPGAGGGKNTKVIAIVAAVVAVLLIAGGGVWFVTQDGGDKDDTSKGDTKGADGTGGPQGGGKPASTKARLVAKMPAPAVDDQVSVPGAWVTEKNFVKTSTESVLGISAKDGSEAWEIPLDGSVCAASPHQTKDDKTALVTRETKSSKAACNQMVVIDLAKGKKLWQETIPGDADVDSLGGGLTISQDTIATAWIGGSAGYKISGGEPLWEAKPSECRDVGYAGGDKLVAVVKCNSSSDAVFKVQTLDPTSGKSTSEFEVPGAESVMVASTDPLVIGIGAGDTVMTDVMTIADGEVAARVALGERYNKPCTYGVETCWGMTVGKDAFYLSTKERTDDSVDYGRTNEIMAFDFQTGKTKWKSDAGSKRTIMPISMAGENVIGYKMPTYDKAGEIVSIDPKTGEQTLYLKLPDDSVDYEQEYGPRLYGQDIEVVWGHGHLLLPEQYVTDRQGTFVKDRLLGVGYSSS